MLRGRENCVDIFKFSLIAASLLATFVSAGNVQCDDLKIVSFEEWSGESINRSEVLSNPVNMTVIQHTVTPECGDDITCEDMMRSMRAHFIHMGYDDFGYSFVVGGNGKVYEGAGWHLVGAHTKRYNERSVGVAFIGNFMDKLPTPDAQKTAQLLLKCGVDNKHLSEEYQLVGHRQLLFTLSPGDKLQNLIETWPHWTKLDA